MSEHLAIVTGVGSGIGKATALVLAQRGYDLGMTYGTNVSSVHELVPLRDAVAYCCSKAGIGMLTKCMALELTELFAKEGADVAIFDIAKTAAAELLDRVAAAGGQAIFYSVTVKGTFLCTKFVVANMLAKRRQGSIVNISSTYGMVGNADLPLYHATKAAVIMMTKSDGVTYAEQGIRFNAVLPGSTRAPMALAAASISPEGADYIQNLVARHPIKRQADPLEIAYRVLFLASDEASYITGTQLAIDGGYTAQ
jgi:NAD(P)-dependent dehydrogenase (short-subunit alcohol dehydrogenase family)